MKTLRLSCVLLLCCSAAVTTVAAQLNVRDFGAAGDGAADDYQALQQATAALAAAETGSELYFPPGDYRIATESGGALLLRGVSERSVRFADGARLVMDNLRPDGTGGGHGVVIAAPGHDLTLDNLEVVWRTRPSARSHGDGFRFEGFPADPATLRGIRLLNCRTAGSPQAGAVFMGVRDITVRNFTVSDNLADGLHFNACRDIDVDGVHGVNTGDDTLAFVTYYAAEFSGECGTVFSFPTLSQWNNSNARARNITAVGGNANGVRISGARGVTVENIRVEGKSCGVILDAGLADMERFHWSYLPSQQIAIRGLSAVNCDSGFFVWSFSPNAPGFTDFSVEAHDLELIGNRNDNLHIWDGQNIRLSNLRSSAGRIRLRGFRNLTLDGLSQRDGYLEVDGDYTAGADARALPPQNGVLRHLELNQAFMTVNHCNGLELERLAIIDAPGSALRVSASCDLDISDLVITRPNRNGGEREYALQLNAVRQLRLTDWQLRIGDKPLCALEIGGGSAEARSGDIAIAGTVESAGSRFRPEDWIRLQTGPYAPEALELQLSAP